MNLTKSSKFYQRYKIVDKLNNMVKYKSKLILPVDNTNMFLEMVYVIPKSKRSKSSRQS